MNPTSMKFDLKAAREFYEFLPWANRPGCLTMLQLKIPGEKKGTSVLRSLAYNEYSFENLLKDRPSDAAFNRPRDFYLCTNPINGSFEDYFHGPFLKTSFWPSTEPFKPLDKYAIAAYEMLCLDIDDPVLASAKKTAYAILMGLKAKSYKIIHSGYGLHIWIPLPPQERLASSRILKPAIVKIGNLTGTQAQTIDDQPLTRFAVLRVPGTYNTKNADKPILVKCIETKKGGAKANESVAEFLAERLKEKLPEKVRRDSIQCTVPESYQTVEEASLWLAERLGSAIYDDSNPFEHFNEHGIHVFNVPAGLGKTEIAAFCAANSEKGILYLAPRHALLAEILKTTQGYIDELGEDEFRTARKLPQFREALCVESMFKKADAAKQKGYLLEVCRTCPLYKLDERKRYKCKYHRRREFAKRADILFAPKHYIKIPPFWKKYGKNRELVIIDESALDEFQEEVKVSIATITHLRKSIRTQSNLAFIKPMQYLLKRISSHREEGLLGSIGELAISQTARDSSVALPKWSKDFRDKLFGVFAATPVRRRKLMRSIEKLLNAFSRTKGKALLYYRGENVTQPFIQFYVPHFLPEGRTYLLFDATSDKRLLDAHFKNDLTASRGWRGLPISVYTPPKIVPNKGCIIQIMDQLCGKRSVLRQLEYKGNKSRKKKIIGLIDRLIEKHPDAKNIGLIAHRDTVLLFHEKLDAKTRVTKTGYFGNLRGTNDFVGCDVLIVVGTYRIPPSVVGQRAAAFSLNPDDVEMTTEVSWRSIDDKMRKERWSLLAPWPREASEFQKAVHKSYVEGELIQAIGRARTIRENVTVYVLTNELIDLPGIQRVFSSELFPGRTQAQRRLDEKSEVYPELCGFIEELLDDGITVYPKVIAEQRAKRYPTHAKKFNRNMIKQKDVSGVSPWSRWVGENGDRKDLVEKQLPGKPDKSGKKPSGFTKRA